MNQGFAANVIAVAAPILCGEYVLYVATAAEFDKMVMEIKDARRGVKEDFKGLKGELRENCKGLREMMREETDRTLERLDQMLEFLVERSVQHSPLNPRSLTSGFEIVLTHSFSLMLLSGALGAVIGWSISK